MPIVKIPNAGAVGVIKDLSAPELPPNAWTDSSNMRFLDGLAHQFYGHLEVYTDPTQTPQYLLPCGAGSTRYWIYTTAAKTYATTVTGDAAVHYDITHLTPRTGVVNQWTGGLLSGVPVLNPGDTVNYPMTWDLNTANKCIDLAAWPANTYCKSMRPFKNFLVALNLTKSGTNFPFMVKWSHPADPGFLPTSWDHTDTTKDAGEADLAEGYDAIIDGLQLRDSFMIYKESSCWRMDYVGGPYVFRFAKVLGITGAMNRNCIADIDGFHVVLTASDVIVHDGNSATSILDKQARRALFSDMDSENLSKCFVFKNPYFNEVFICYPSLGQSSCDKAVVWNYVDKTVSYRTLPSINHAAFGMVDSSTYDSWSADGDSWDSDATSWASIDVIPGNARVLLAPATTKLYLMDASYTAGATPVTSYLERRGLTFGAPERRKLIRSVRPRIYGGAGDTVLIKVGYSDDPYAEPTYSSAVTHTIGTTVSNDFLISGRYIALRFEPGTATTWRLDSFDVDVMDAGAW